MSVALATPAQVRLELIARREIALIDLREEGVFARGHPLFAASLPLSRLELEVLDRIPRKATPIVIYGNGEGLSAYGAERLAALGYSDVRVLDGGLDGWAAAGFELFLDVNSYSKAFGELVEARAHTPGILPEELKARLDRREDLVVLDARRFEEYRTMSIPSGVSVPGAELVLRAREIAPDPDTTIVVNCAGRTRSLIGAQSLINAGVPNRVFALRNGTIGWTLAGQDLERGADRRFPEVAENREAQAATAARAVAYRAGVRRIGPADLERLAQDETRTLYRFDVRTPEEFAGGHAPGFRSAPGGQLVQETDVFAPVRGARIVLYDDTGVRADMTASWLAQMGWDVLVLEGLRASALTEKGPGAYTLPPLSAPPSIPLPELAERLKAGKATVIDLAPSPAYRAGHIPGAAFAIRSRLIEALTRLSLEERGQIVLTSPDGLLARLAAPEAEAITGRPVSVVPGGTLAWVWAEQPLEAGEGRALSPFEDVYRRPYEGTDSPREAMQAYLDWEFGLVAQLERDGSHGFFVI